MGNISKSNDRTLDVIAVLCSNIYAPNPNPSLLVAGIMFSHGRAALICPYTLKEK